MEFIRELLSAQIASSQVKSRRSKISLTSQPPLERTHNKKFS